MPRFCDGCAFPYDIYGTHCFSTGLERPNALHLCEGCVKEVYVAAGAELAKVANPKARELALQSLLTGVYDKARREEVIEPILARGRAALARRGGPDAYKRPRDPHAESVWEE